MNSAHPAPTSQEPWWVTKSIVNQFVLPLALAITVLWIASPRGPGDVPPPQSKQDETPRELKETPFQLGRLQERTEQAERQAQRESAREEEERRRERQRQREAEKEERQRQQELAEQAKRHQRELEILRAELADLQQSIKSQSDKIAVDAAQARTVSEPARKQQTTQTVQSQTASSLQDPAKVIAAARAKKAALQEKQAAEMLVEAERLLSSDGGSVRRARSTWHAVIESFPSTSAAKQAAKYLAETRSQLNDENEIDAAVALKAAHAAYENGGLALARLRYGSIMVHYPTTHAAKAAQKMYKLLR